MTVTALKIKAREILISNPDMLVSLDAEFGYLLHTHTDFNYAEDEFLCWLIDFFIETDNGQENFLMN